MSAVIEKKFIDAGRMVEYSVKTDRFKTWVMFRYVYSNGSKSTWCRSKYDNQKELKQDIPDLRRI